MIKPGPELDELVLSKVFGKTVGQVGWLQNYSTDIRAAWEVVVQMQNNDCAFILDNLHDIDGHLGSWQAHFEKKECLKTGESKSAPHAICLAALKAVGVEIK